MKTRAQVWLAVVFMATGVAVYLFDRSAERVYFVPDGWQAIGSPLFGSLGASLPSFAHVVFFILISAAILAPLRPRIVSICLLWFGIDSLFELAQHDAIAGRIAEVVPAWFDRIWLLENTRAYLLAGTFDPLDILSIAAGSFAAYAMLHITRSLEHENDT